MMNTNELIPYFKTRGYCQQVTHEDELIQRAEIGPITGYAGFDPTADSLHVGHLIPIMGLANLQRFGHKPIALLGGGTAMIGDPSGKTEMRKMIQAETIDANLSKIKAQMERFMVLDGEQGILVNNADWLRNLNYIDFLREIGSHFSVNRMLSFETYKMRLETGLSFLEFNYQLLQAYDFLELKQRYGCELQLGGDDQWANIISGVDLIRRLGKGSAFGWTFPLLTTASGKKMGKTEKGAVWLDPEKTSPYDYYQYWVNLDDADVSKCLKLFTFLENEEVEELSRLQGAEIRTAKQKLAFEATKIVHGEEEASRSERAAKVLFGGGAVASEDVPTTHLSVSELGAGMDVFEIFTKTGLCKSKGEARRLLNQGGVYVNGERIDDEAFQITAESFGEEGVLLRKGKKHYHRVLLNP